MSNNDLKDTYVDKGGWSFAKLSINRPIFITCVVLVTMITGYLSMRTLPVDLFPDVTFPVVTVTTQYPGAGPRETEMLISKIFEEEFSTISGVKTIRSINQEGVSIVVAEFTFSTDIKYAEQQVRDKVSSAKADLPDDIEEPVIRRVDPSDQPIVTIALTADMTEAELYDLANLTVKPKIEQVNNVGLVEIMGGREREIRVDLDLNKMKFRQVSAIQVADALGKAGSNIPSGKIDVSAKQETVFRTLGEFQTIDEMKNTIVQFLGNDVPIVLSDVATVREGLEDEKNIGYVNGKRSLLVSVYRQTGANTVAVADNVVKQVGLLNANLAKGSNKAELTVVRDGSKAIKDNLFDVQESITIGIILTIIVVFFFLASFRSTVITSLALPNSLLGAFVLLAVAGYTINVMSLLALSLAVGLLIDDAIVVRENIFRHMEMGKDARTAALHGTQEVMLAVIATTFTVIAVFGPIAFISGVVGQFLKQFGMTVCFALIISMFDAITIAPMMSAYFAGKGGHVKPGQGTGFYDRTVGKMLAWFDRFQGKLEDLYVWILKVTLNNPIKMILGGILIFAFSIYTLKFVPKTFLAAQDNGEFSVNLDLPPGTSLREMERVAKEVDTVIRGHKEVAVSLLTVGTKDGEANKANFYVRLVGAKERKVNTIQFKDIVRKELQPFSYANVQVSDFDQVGAGQRPFNVNIQGNDEKQLAEISTQVFEKMKNHPALLGVDLSYRPGKPEFQVIPERLQAERLGISTNVLGMELRTLMEGQTPAVYRLKGEEYDIRVRLREDQRNLQKEFNNISIPNINGRMIPLKTVVEGVETTGPANITRQDRARYYQISADIAPNGPGMGGAMTEVARIFKEDIKLPEGMSYKFVGQAENFGEMIESMAIASGLGILFIYLVLASLYESFVTPFTIMLVLPLAMCGAFFALALTGASLDLFSMIGCIMLLGVATKNSIILVDYTNQQMENHGMSLRDAILLAGKNRLRPILMTSFALIAGFVPIAVGLNEASAQRTSMGIALIGGLISSTLLTLIIVPAAYTYIERFRLFVNRIFSKLTGADTNVQKVE
ncbi:efflux RND transporter permease subunit [Peredibacter starrii]|uniref:Efflux RND transporter permease subunit n=1 Tax=Peredibacter starrii TaxID=28202 RepID=A0AAX4HLH0_9BACT|nr:efflux RND transporter permease subunit [Peredibacter starrii]WPU64162.1 efflux RND transporter permease subunit [Peredibacter starrii]